LLDRQYERSIVTGTKAAARSYSQFGEDVQIVDFFGGDFVGTFLDVGANDGVRDSNTLLLEEYGWSGILVEANPSLASRAAERRPRCQVFNRVVGASVPDKLQSGCSFFLVSGGQKNLDGLSTIKMTDHLREQVRVYGGRIEEVQLVVSTLEEIWRTANLAPAPDFVSLDVEGSELEALKGYDWQCRPPRLLLIEDGTRNLDQSVAKYLLQRGFYRVHRTGVNDWYVGSGDLALFRRQRLVLFLRFLKWRLNRPRNIASDPRA
jgi:FkbM family methyltransferase